MTLAGDPRLVADGVVDLFRISLPFNNKFPDVAQILDTDDWDLFMVNGVGTPGETVNFDGQAYEVAPISLEGENSQTSDGQKSRPSLVLGLPKLVWGHSILQAQQSGTGMTGALLSRLRMTASVFETGTEADAIHNIWVVSRMLNGTKEALNFELRDPLDRFNMKLPPREFEPPEFPTVISGR